VIPTRAAIIPAAIGMDIGCGMVAVKTDLVARDLPESLSRVRSQIEHAVPVGFDFHKNPIDPKGDDEAKVLVNRMKQLEARFTKLRILGRIGRLDHARVWGQLGSLGGGNHFIELCLDTEGAVWIMLHSGSRNAGKTIGEGAMNMAKEVAKRVDRQLPDRDLAWLDEGTPEFDAYVEALRGKIAADAGSSEVPVSSPTGRGSLWVSSRPPATLPRSVGTVSDRIDCPVPLRTGM